MPGLRSPQTHVRAESVWVRVNDGDDVMTEMSEMNENEQDESSVHHEIGQMHQKWKISNETPTSSHLIHGTCRHHRLVSKLLALRNNLTGGPLVVVKAIPSRSRQATSTYAAICTRNFAVPRLEGPVE